MIKLYSGNPGGGKSYALTQLAYQGLKEGRKVFSNVPIRGSYILTFEDLVEYRFPEGSLVLIDESGRWFNSRNWSKLPDRVFDLFTLHRHVKLDLVIAVQSYARIDKALREVVGVTYWTSKLWLVPIFKHEIYYDVELLGSMNPAHRNGVKYVWFRKKIAELYDTHTMKKAFDGMDYIPERIWEIEEVEKIPLIKRLCNKVKHCILTRKEQKEEEERINDEIRKRYKD